MNEFFCGWYFKCQSEERTLAVIPALHRSRGVQTYSIQLITDTGAWNVPFWQGSLRTHGSRPCAVIGANRFSGDGLQLDLHTANLSAVGSLRFHGLSPIRYDIMGPFRYVPFMECRHCVFSMRHAVNGSLRVNGRDYRFQDGVGYIEGDRGRSFPRRYVWTQCCFPAGSLMLSVAEIPLGPARFTGIIGIVQWQGREYRLATYLGACAEAIGDGGITVRQGSMALTARLLEKAAHPLLAPAHGAMTRIIREGAACRAQYRFVRNGQVLFDCETARASFEYEYPQEDAP